MQLTFACGEFRLNSKVVDTVIMKDFPSFGHNLKYNVTPFILVLSLYIDWIPRIFRGLERVEISFFGWITSIELVEFFKIDPIFFEFFWIFSNKIVFEMVFYLAFKAVRSRKDTLYIFWTVLAHCIYWYIWPRLGELGKGRHHVVNMWFIDFTGVEIA